MFTRLDNLTKGLAGIALLVVGCGTLVGNPEEEEDSKGATTEVIGTENAALTFKIADAPIDYVDSVFVTISGVEVQSQDANWIPIPLVLQQEIDLLKYQDGASLAFAQSATIPAGNYIQTRFLLSEIDLPRVVLKDGTVKELAISSEALSVVIDTPFNAEAGKAIEITLDFDLRRSLKVEDQGEEKVFKMEPVLRLLKEGEFGQVEGEETQGQLVCVFPEHVVPDVNDTCEHAVNSGLVKDGRYKVGHMPKGKYQVQVYDSLGKAIAGKKTDVEVQPLVKSPEKSNDKVIHNGDSKNDDEVDDDDDKNKDKSDDKHKDADEKESMSKSKYWPKKKSKD